MNYINRFEKKASDSNFDKETGLVLGIDPGRDKCGLAVLDYDLNVICSDIVKTIGIESYLYDIFNNYNIRNIVIGDGTYSREINKLIKGLSEVPVKFIDEAYTTVEAEKRYLKENKNGWWKLLSFIRWKPSVAVDNYVAIILAERFIKDQICTGRAES